MADDEYSKILAFIETFSYAFPEYILKQAKKEKTLHLITQVMNRTGKELSEAVILTLSLIKYILRDGEAFVLLEETKSFQHFMKVYHDRIIELSTQKNVQANLPERALPFFEIFDKKIKDNDLPIAVIELGASYGLVGYCLLNPTRVIEGKERYLLPEQKIPRNPRAAAYYLGIEIEPPEKEWMLACEWELDADQRLRNFLDDTQPTGNFRLLKANAFGFSKLEEVKNLAAQPFTIIVATSFMFYQFNKEKQKELRDEILRFIDPPGFHWINQAVNIDGGPKESKFFIEWNGKEIMELPDDRCSNWWWK